MKALKKNIYVITTLVLFIIAAAMLGLFIALFGASTAVDGTTVGNIYIGDKKEEKDLKQTLVQNVNSWKKQAVYTISFQGIEVVIGKTETLDENGDVVVNDKGETQYTFNGLYFLNFDYETTKKYIQQDKGNEAYYTITAEAKQEFFETLVDAYGAKLCEKNANGDLTNLQFDKLVDDIEKDARAMKSICDYDLYDYLNDGWLNWTTSIEVANLSEAKVNEIVKMFEDNPIELLPQKKTNNKLGFSAIELFSKEEFDGMSSSDMSVVATGLAAVVQNTSLTVTVKNQGYINDQYYAVDSMTARVNIKDGTDLRIINPESSSYIVTITKGNKAVDGTYSLKFSITGCQFVSEYSVVKNTTKIDYEMLYDERSMSFNYEKELIENPDLVGIDQNYQNGCYYYIYQEGKDTYLYSYTKTITHVDGTKETVEVYPKQEFFEGQDELRYWTKEGYTA